MHPLSLRRSPRPRSRFDEVPEDILILIFCHCRIDELFALRLTSSKARDIISERIATIAPCVARSTFPRSDLLLTPPADPSVYSINWLKGLIPLQLASILVDQHRFAQEWAGMPYKYGIPAEDPYGNELRATVANGWRVLQRMSRISKEVYKMHPKDLCLSTAERAYMVVRPSRFKFDVFRKREELILQKRLKCIAEMPSRSLRDYRSMIMMLSSVFRTTPNPGELYPPWIFDYGNGLDNQRLIRRGGSWMLWFILSEGPDLFWKQWWALSPEDPDTKNYIRDKALEAWFSISKVPTVMRDPIQCASCPDADENWHDIQRDHGQKAQKEMANRANVPAQDDFQAIFHVFGTAELNRQERERAGLPLFKETFCHVPFFVDFRRPEALTEKSNNLAEQKYVEVSRTLATSRPRSR